MPDTTPPVHASVAALVADLGHPDAATRTAARDALPGFGAAAVAPLLAALTDTPDDRTRWLCRSALTALGPLAFGPAVAALAAAPEDRRHPDAPCDGNCHAVAEPTRRLRALLASFGPDCAAGYAAALDHPSVEVRETAARGLGACGAAGLPHAPTLLPLLGAADQGLRQAAQHALVRLGPDTVPLLRQVRRAGPGTLRRGALAALAELCDPRDLDPADLAALRRLISVKLPDDRPGPVTACFLSWIAVRTGDRQGVLDLLGLTAPEPATFALGTAAVDCDSHDHEDAPPFPQYARVFVTPALDGWTLVAGSWCNPCDPERSDEVAGLCRELSARYGSAQAYWYGAQNDGAAWLVAEDGVLLRRAASFDDEAAPADPDWWIGDPLPFEQQERARVEAAAEAAGEDPADEWEWALLDLPLRLSAALGVDPHALGPDTPAHGHGVLALTPYGAEHGVPPGALPI
ncbi:HEAT repeat domain-containing protein [Kitasatospora sp. NPDC088134]|uniref:HEAT repeat domain-containing protein n=1 Tax=Kitasatospora sp. NPDC088134 TaxID=3364071 RepID=UPI0037F8A32E